MGGGISHVSEPRMGYLTCLSGGVGIELLIDIEKMWVTLDGTVLLGLIMSTGAGVWKL